MKHKVLGRGLSALLKDEVVTSDSHPSNNLSIELIEPNKQQPRKLFNEQKIQELAASIVSHGLVQPIIVSATDNGKYKIVAGERRYRACKLAGLAEVPVVIKDLSEQDILEIALIENIQRQELTAIEEAEGFKQLIDDYGYSHTELASVLGKSRSHIANLLRLNGLPNTIKNMVNEGVLSMGHARCLVGLENAEELATKIVANDLNVRQTEQLVNQTKNTDVKKSLKSSDGAGEANEDLMIIGQKLSEKFGIRVVFENTWNGGKLSFYYQNLEELDLLLEKLN